MTHLHIKLKSFSNTAQPLHKEAVRHCSFSLIIAKKSVIMSEAFLVDVSIEPQLGAPVPGAFTHSTKLFCKKRI